MSDTAAHCTPYCDQPCSPECERRAQATAAPRRTFWSAKQWRNGRKVGRTIYAQMGDEPSDDDVLIGVMDTPELASLVVLAVNGYQENPYGD